MMMTLKVSALGKLTDRKLALLSQANRDMQLERNSQGELIFMAPTGGETGYRNFNLVVEFGLWNRQMKLGAAFDSSTGFKLPNQAVRSADLAWVKQARWQALAPTQRKEFPPLCPDFVIELRSESDSLKPLQDKMQEWITNGCLLGWLIDCKQEKVYVYRADGSIQVVPSFEQTLEDNALLPGFELDLKQLR
jgi:Uma2 family endonuclease